MWPVTVILSIDVEKILFENALIPKLNIIMI